MKLNNIFEQLEPPPHGLIKLRNKILMNNRYEVSHHVFSWNLLKNRFVQTGAFCVLVLVATFLFYRAPQNSNLFASLAQIDGAEIFAQVGYQPASTGPVVQLNGRASFLIVQQTPAQNNVRFYWVQ